MILKGADEIQILEEIKLNVATMTRKSYNLAHPLTYVSPGLSHGLQDFVVTPFVR